MTDEKKATDGTKRDERVAGLASGEATVSGLTDPVTKGRSADLSDPGSDPVEDEPSALDGPFRPIADWLAPAKAADALRRMDRGIDGGDVYADVLGARAAVDPTLVTFVVVQQRLAEVEQHLKSLRGSPALRTLVDALAKAGRMDRMRGWLATPASKAELDARVIALRQRARLDEVWRAIEPQFAGDAIFDWAEQRLHRENGIARTLSETEWRATIERVAQHDVVVDGKAVRVRVQNHAEWIRASIEEELKGTTLVNPRKAELWTTDLLSSMDAAAARSYVEETISALGGRIGEVASANPLMNVRGRAVASPDALVTLCATDAEARADVRDKLKSGKLSVVLENWIDGIAEERDRGRPRQLYDVLTRVEQTWRARDPELGLRAFLWAAGEIRLQIGDESVTSVRELIAAVDGRPARLTPLLSSGEIENWLRHAIDDKKLADLARTAALNGELGAWILLWAAGEKRLRLGRRVAKSVADLASAIGAYDDVRRHAAAAIADGFVREWLEHAQDRNDLAKLVDANRKLPRDDSVWALAYAAGLEGLAVDDDVVVTAIADLAAWLRGNLNAFAERIDANDDNVATRLRFWLKARAPAVDATALLGFLAFPRYALHAILFGAGSREVWLDDDGPPITDSVGLAERLARHRGLITRAAGADPDGLEQGDAKERERAADHARVLTCFANGSAAREALLGEIAAVRAPALRAAAVIRTLDPNRPIAVGGTMVTTRGVDGLALARTVCAALDQRGLWVDIDAARVVIQELVMSLRAAGADAAWDCVERALFAVPLPSDELVSARPRIAAQNFAQVPLPPDEAVPSSISIFPADDVTRAGVIQAIFALHDGPRPFRPDVGVECQTLVKVAWFFARQSQRYADELVAVERRLWLEQQGRADLADTSLPDFLLAVFPLCGSLAVEVRSASIDEGAGVEVTWVLRRRIVIFEPRTDDEKEADTGSKGKPVYQHVDDTASSPVQTSRLSNARGGAAKRADALGAELAASVAARAAVDPARIENDNELGALVLAAIKEGEVARRAEQRRLAHEHGPHIARVAFGAVLGGALPHIARAGFGAVLGGLLFASLRVLVGLSADGALRGQGGAMPESLDAAVAHNDAVVASGIGALVVIAVVVVIAAVVKRRSQR